VQLFYRTLQNPFIQLDMLDNGSSGDAGAGDGIYTATVPAMADRTVVEFYIQASDAGSNTRTYPAPGINQVGQPAQVLNMVYQVDDSTYSGTQPFYRIILTEANRVELQNINRQSDAEVHCTFVTVDGVETQVRHNCGVRTRGAGSRGANPSNYRLNIPNDNPWKGLDAINLNTQFTHAQAVGSVVAQRSGMTAADARLVQVRVNGINLANAGSPQFGSYVAVEPINSEFAENHYPSDPDGNVYRASSGSHQADLSYRSDPATLIAAGYSKTSKHQRKRLERPDQSHVRLEQHARRELHRNRFLRRRCAPMDEVFRHHHHDCLRRNRPWEPAREMTMRCTAGSLIRASNCSHMTSTRFLGRAGRQRESGAVHRGGLRRSTRGRAISSPGVTLCRFTTTNFFGWPTTRFLPPNCFLYSTASWGAWSPSPRLTR
jgi:hypothetical protein